MAVEIENLYEILFQDEQGNIYTTTTDYDHSHLCDINPHHLRLFTREDMASLFSRLLDLL